MYRVVKPYERLLKRSCVALLTLLIVLLISGCVSMDVIQNSNKTKNDTQPEPLPTIEEISNVSSNAITTEYSQTTTYEDETHKDVKYGEFSFDIYNYHVVRETIGDTCIYECEPDSLEWKIIPRNMTITIKRVVKPVFENNADVQKFLSDMLPDFTAIKMFTDVTDTSGVSDMYAIAIEDGDAIYYVQHLGDFYEIKTDCNRYWFNMFEVNRDSDLEIQRTEIECADGYTASLVKTISGKKELVQYELLQGKDGCVYFLDVIGKSEASYQAVLTSNEGAILQEFSAEHVTSNLSHIFEFKDLNYDGYADVVLLIAQGTSNLWYDIYIWDCESRLFSIVSSDLRFGEITVYPEYIQNAYRNTSDSTHVKQKLIWKDSMLVIQSSAEYSDIP